MGENRKRKLLDTLKGKFMEIGFSDELSSRLRVIRGWPSPSAVRCSREKRMWVAVYKMAQVGRVGGVKAIRDESGFVRADRGSLVLSVHSSFSSCSHQRQVAIIEARRLRLAWGRATDWPTHGPWV